MYSHVSLCFENDECIKMTEISGYALQSPHFERISTSVVLVRRGNVMVRFEDGELQVITISPGKSSRLVAGSISVKVPSSRTELDKLFQEECSVHYER